MTASPGAGWEELEQLVARLEAGDPQAGDVFVAEAVTRAAADLRRGGALDPDAASRFLLAATRLLELRLRELLPPPARPAPATGEAGAEEEGEGPDPALVERLLAYRPFRAAAAWLEERAREEGLHFTRIPEELDEVARAADLRGLSLDDLLAALEAALRSARRRRRELRVEREPLSVAERMRRLVQALRRHGGRMRLQDLLERDASRFEVVVTFLAVLELLRRRRVRAVQEAPLGPIELILLEPAGPARAG